MNNNVYINRMNQIRSTFKYNVYSLTSILMILGILIISANSLQAQIAPVIAPTGGFEIDGGLESGTPTNTAGDWVFGSGSFFVLNNNGTPVTSTTSGMVTDEYNTTGDLSFNASKFDQDPNTWSWTASKPSSKNDINQVLYHIGNDGSNNTWLIVAGDRLSTNGTSYIDFEFLQNTLTRNSSGGFNSAGPDGGRTINDIVLSMEYDNGGSLATVHMYFWKNTGAGYQYVEQTIPAGVAFAMTNGANENVPFGAFGTTSYSPYQFVEGAINLSAFFGYIDPCFGISVNTLLVKTKASTSTTSSLGDFVEPIQVKFNFGTASIEYSADLCKSGVANVNLIGVPGGTYTSSPAGLSLNSSTGQINLASSNVGTYTVTYSFVTNNCPKSVTTSVTVNPMPSAPTLVSADRNLVCTDDNGNITLTASGGSGTTLQWFSGSCTGTSLGTGSSITIPSPSSTTTYYASWTNSCGVSSCAQATVTVSQLMSVTASGSSQVSCNDGNDGTITINATGGNGVYSYSLNGGPVQSSNVFTGLQSGSYTATVFDGLNCSGTSNAVTISNPSALSASASGSSQVTCYNSNDGTITASATGGTGSYLYSINGGAFQSSSTFSGLSSGSYTINVKDAEGCNANTPAITIANPAQIAVTATNSSQVSCNNSVDGSVTATATGGTGSYSYSINGGAFQSSNTFSGLQSGIYMVTVTDENNCSAITKTLTIANPTVVSASASGSSQVSCNNSSDGTVTVSANGGTGSYSYSLNGGAFQSSNEFSGLPSGTYVITVKDENNCSANTTALNIANPVQLSASATGSSQVSCNNASDGQIVASANGGTGAYQYSINGGPFQSSANFSGLASGSYIIAVRDAKGCIASASGLTIANPASITASAIGSAQVSCFNSNDGTITVSANGGTGSYSYSLNGGAFQSSNVFSGQASGSYVITVKDANQCSASTATVTIANPALLTASATGSAQVTCHNLSDGLISVSATGGTGAYSYSLNGGAFQSSNSFSGLTSGSYVITVRDSKNCSANTVALTIANPAMLSASATGSAQVSCFNSSDGTITVTAHGGTGALSYSLNGGVFQSSNVFNGQTSGSYVITVQDANQCSANTAAISIANPASLAASATGSSQVSCNNSTDGSITVSAFGGTGSYSYSLNGGAFQSSNVFNGQASGSYVITVKDANQCSVSTAAVTIANPALLIASATGSSQVSCHNFNDGSITVSANGGTGSYSYSLNGGAFQSSNIFSAQPSGSYIITVRDANQCSANTAAITIANPVMLAASATGSAQVSCYNSNDGIITVSANGGTGSYSYSLNGGAFQSSNIFSSQPSGSYVITVHDANACSVNTSAIAIANPAVLFASATGSAQLTCNNSQDGIVTVSATGGTGSYSYSLNGSPVQSSNIFTGLASGSYVVSVFDQNSCPVNASPVVIANPSTIVASASGSAQVSCNNLSDGTITVSASGGTGSYSYSLNGAPVQSSNVFNGLSSGSYVITVYDQNNCFTPTSILNIANPQLMQATVYGTPQVSCHNVTDGQITVSATGGTGAYLYSINGGPAQTSNVFSGLASGTYSIIVTDGNKCPATACTISIANPELLSASAIGSSQVSCNNYNDGSITVTAAGGTGSYSYSLNGGQAQVSNSFEELESGYYSIVVSDANGCLAYSPAVTITNPALLSVSALASAQVSCHNASDGNIAVSVQGGTGSYTYSLNGGQTQSSDMFEGLSSGTFVISVFDDNGCYASASPVLIANPAPLSVFATGSSQVSCHNAADGTVSANAEGGTGSYSYSINGGQYQSSGVFSGLANGTYVINVMDEKNCSSSAQSFVIANPEQLTLYASASAQVSCHDSRDGLISTTVSGGTGAYSFSLNGGAEQSLNSFNGLGSGTYTVSIFDENNCSVSSAPLFIDNPAPLSISATASSQVKCNNSSDATISATTTGGTGSYSYSLNGGAEQSSSEFIGLPSGTYVITVFDENNCSARTSKLAISNPAPLSASALGSSQVSCHNSSDGSITVNTTGGTGSYSFSLNGGPAQSSNIFNGLIGGSYIITVLDENNCVANTSALKIANPELLQAYASGSAQVSCYNVSDGNLSVVATGGTGSYSYSLNGGQSQSSSEFNGLSAGSYIVNVFDENNCPSGTNAIVIANPATLFASVSQSSPVTCYNGNNGALTVNAEGGTGSYTYSLNGGLAQSVSEFSSLTAGSYTVVISDEFGCSASSSLLISSPEPVTVSAQQSQVNCFGAFDATLSVNAAGGTPPYAYSIDGGQTYQYTNSFDSLKAGTFNIMVYDANNCPAQAFSFNVVQSSPIVANVNVVSGNKCFGSNDASAEINIQEGIFPLTYSLDHGSYFTNGLMEGLSAGHHTIRILDSLGCGIETDFFIEPQLPIVIDLISSSYADCSGKRDGSIGIEANGGQGPFSYSWSNGQSSSNIEGLSIGEYVVTVTDELGCTSTFSKLVTVGPVETPLEMNNAFSPNGDGINDLWVIDNLELYPDNQLVIINRWGNEVLTVNGYKNNWDGSQLNEGTYFYILKVNMCDEDKTFDGYITILR